MERAMGFDPSKRALDVFKNLEGNLPPNVTPISWSSLASAVKAMARTLLRGRVPVATVENPPLENRPLYEFFTYSGEMENSDDRSSFRYQPELLQKQT
jgi:hypothetical protein